MAATASTPAAAKRAKLPNKLANKRPHYFAPVQQHLTHHSSSSPSSMQNKPPPPQQQQQQSEQAEQGEEQNPSLLPGLPEDLARQCLANVPPSLLFAVCHKWRRFMYSPSFPNPSSSVYALLADSDDNSLSFASYDPLSAKWEPLPPPPLPSPLLLKHPRFISRLLPIQTISSSSSSSLLLISASTPTLEPALHSPLIFHPSPPRWLVGPSFPISPRRWCVTGSLNGSIYLFSGVGSLHYNASLTRSAFKWDTNRSVCHWKWEPLASLRDATFSREAVEAVSSDGKLFMVNLRGRCPKEGLVYNAHMDQWDDMPSGLLSGWIGPAMADENDGNIYVVDDSTGTLKLYHWATDSWQTVASNDRLKGATQMAARGGKVCVVAGGGAVLVVVDVKASGRRIWTVEPPPGKKLLNVHILPRMSRGDS